MDTHTHTHKQARSEVLKSFTPTDVVMLSGHTHAECKAGREYTFTL